MNDHKRDNYTLRISYICEDNFWWSVHAWTESSYSIFSMLELSLNLGLPSLEWDVAICPCIWLF